MPAPATAPPRVPLARVLLVLAAAAVTALAGVASVAATMFAETAGESAGTNGEDPGAGDGYAVWARNPDGRPVRWDPCSPLRLVVNPAGAPPRALDDLERAVEAIAGASGLDLRIEGEVAERPSAQRRVYQPHRYGHRWAPVLVAWDGPEAGGLPLRSFDRGIAVPVAVAVADTRVFVSGQVVLNRDRSELRPGFDDRAASWGATLLHELGHLVGLDHVDDPAQLMHHTPGEGPAVLGTGDLAGLAALGGDGGCLEVPGPRHVEVELTVVR